MNIKNLHILEGANLLRLTAPIILAQLSQTAMGFVDTVMAGRVSPTDLAAVAVGSSIFFPLFLFVVGLLSAVTPFTAQAHGRRDNAGIRLAMQQGMVVGLIAGIIMQIILSQVSPILRWMDVSTEIIPLTRQYLFAVSWGFPFAGLFLALRNGTDGLSQPRLSMFAGFFGLLVNVIANYVLIYGKLGFPAMGGVGCGWATSLSMLAMFGAMAFMLRKNRLTAGLGIFTTLGKSIFQAINTLIFLGLPIALSLFVECSIFAVIALLIAQLGAEIVASHQIALNFTSLLFMLPYSLSTALTVRVGFVVGKQRKSRLLRVVQSGISIAAACACCTCLFILVFARDIAALYTPDPFVQATAAGLLVFAAIFQIPDAIQVNCAGALRGCKDTRVPMILMVAAYWGIGLPVGYMLGLKGAAGMAQGPEGFWIGLICGLTTSAVLLAARLYTILTKKADLLAWATGN